MSSSAAHNVRLERTDRGLEPLVPGRETTTVSSNASIRRFRLAGLIHEYTEKRHDAG
jgi:hypothetical protein